MKKKCEEDSIAATPISRHLRDLSRGMDIVLSTPGAPPFPLLRQGMGTRSLGTFFTFRAFVTWRQAGSAAVHPMTALEEPESHLHPQAQVVPLDQNHAWATTMRGDLHHLFACEQKCNSFRRNTPYFEFKEEAVMEDCCRSSNRLAARARRRARRSTSWSGIQA